MNRTYEFVFLITEPGNYQVEAILDHSLCDGLRDPPSDWFIVGKFIIIIIEHTLIDNQAVDLNKVEGVKSSTPRGRPKGVKSSTPRGRPEVVKSSTPMGRPEGVESSTPSGRPEGVKSSTPRGTPEWVKSSTPM